MKIVILRDPEEAQQFLVQSLWFQRTLLPTTTTVKPILEWAMEIAAGGQPLPPLGMIGDFGHTAYGSDRDARTSKDALTIPGLPPTLMRAYEDHVLGKLYADWTFERASDAMRRFTGQDRARGVSGAEEEHVVRAAHEAVSARHAVGSISGAHNSGRPPQQSAARKEKSDRRCSASSA